MKRSLAILVMLASLVLAACSSLLKPPVEAEAQLAATPGSRAEGVVRFTEIDGGVLLDAEVTGLSPGRHGLHVHEKGDCSAPDGTGVGEHFTPPGKRQASVDGLIRHLGDMPMLVADADGNAKLKLIVEGLALAGKGAGKVIGKAIVIHARPDDYTRDPARYSDARVACGVIQRR